VRVPVFVSGAFAAIAFVPMSVASATDVQKVRAEIRKMCDQTLATLYKAKPEIKTHIAKSAGYGCFSSFGVTVIFGGAGGRGLVHNNATKKDTFMNLAQASAGVELAIKDYREVLVFKDRNTLAKFVDSGWELTGGGGAAAEVKNKGGSVEQASAASAGIEIYPMTRTGIAAGGSAAGRKYWKDHDLN